MRGGVRLGSNINTEQSFALGFDHIALCLGAGKPKYINSASYFFKGVKSAADFLMNLQQKRLKSVNLTTLHDDEINKAVNDPMENIKILLATPICDTNR